MISVTGAIGDLDYALVRPRLFLTARTAHTELPPPRAQNEGFQDPFFREEVATTYGLAARGETCDVSPFGSPFGL